MTASPAPAPAGDGWRVEPPLPADRGLVARLLEECVRTEPALAPEVAAGTQRAGAWLHRTRPAWSGLVVAPEQAPRRILGYADVVAVPGEQPAADGTATSHRTRVLLLAPGAAGTGVEDSLRAAAAAAVAELDAAVATAPPAGVFAGLDEDGPPTRLAPLVTVRRRPVAALAGALAIAVAGVAAVLAVEVGVGPLGGVLPFLAPDEPVTTSTVDGPAAPADTDPVPPAPVQPVVDAGAPLLPLPDPGPAAGTPDGSGTDGPGGPGTSPPPSGPPAPPAEAPGAVSSLLDPVVSTLTAAVDGATGGALAPVTGTVEGTSDTTTDLLDGTVDQVVGLLPAPAR